MNKSAFSIYRVFHL